MSTKMLIFRNKTSNWCLFSHQKSGYLVVTMKWTSAAPQEPGSWIYLSWICVVTPLCSTEDNFHRDWASSKNTRNPSGVHEIIAIFISGFIHNMNWFLVHRIQHHNRPLFIHHLQSHLWTQLLEGVGFLVEEVLVCLILKGSQFPYKAGQWSSAGLWQEQLSCLWEQTSCQCSSLVHSQRAGTCKDWCCPDSSCWTWPHRSRLRQVNETQSPQQPLVWYLLDTHKQ